VRAGPAIGSDETGARVAGKTAWQWVFRTTAASYHGIVPRRNADAIAAFLGDARPEGGVSDLWSPRLGADVSAIFTSLLITARKRGENLFQALRSVAGPSPLHAAGVPTRADTNCSHNVSIA
jgi:hypothetical protein